jgi:hypothetical protein
MKARRPVLWSGRPGDGDVNVRVELIERVLQRRVVTYPRSDLDQAATVLNEVAVRCDVGQVRIAESDIGPPSDEHDHHPGEHDQGGKHKTYPQRIQLPFPPVWVRAPA